MTKGISYSKWFKDDWRNSDKLAISHTLLSHAISIYYFLTNSIDTRLNTKIFHNKSNNSFDNALAVSIEKKPIFSAIASWGSPLIDDKIEILTTNYIITLENNLLTARSPRDTFGSNGYFASPSISFSEKFESKEIEPALKSFFESCKNKLGFNEKLFKHSLLIGRLCFESEIIY